MPMPTGKRTVQDSQNGLCAKILRRQRIQSAWIPGFVDLENSEFPATLRGAYIPRGPNVE